MLRLALLASALTLPSLASADDFIPLTYQEFEAAVPHVDLAVCPVPLAAPDRFCRMTSHADQLNVFVFSEDGDQPLVAFRSWPADLLVGLMD
ncbi:MAG: hypothetical protein WAT35_03215 [Tabrizicola sp.]|jgi:hypothetical protein|uniref:hypothetical protein n=1 Tax=Tabrizicola sp. TaxID=2005166 RepID=UPI001B6D5297|nr:hypothetical protein [Tabrizicola sp.]MCC6518377.1 hypothetical protein [Tabrizicola sp.]